MINKRAFRDILQFFKALLFAWLYIPHFMVILIKRVTSREVYELVNSDVHKLKKQINIAIGKWGSILYLLHNSQYFRSLF